MPSAITSCANSLLVPDGNWTDESFANRYHAELANGLGNLVNRSLTMLTRYRKGIVPLQHDELAAEAIAARDKLVDELKSNELQAGIDDHLGFHRTNEPVR